MSRLAWIVLLATLTAAPAAAQQGAIPDLRGTWKGTSESIILGAGNPHHAAPPSTEPRLNSVAFTVTIDKQDGRLFSGTFSSPRGSEKFVAAISRNNTILLVDDDGYTVGTILAPSRMEWCYMHRSQTTSMVSCTKLTKSRLEPRPRTGRWKASAGAPYGTRTRVSAVKGRCPRPLDEGRLRRGDI
jgi:hypothetical protein